MKPIPFRHDMIVAVRTYRKDVTRRPASHNKKGLLRCPYGGPGELLWVRETYGLKDNGYLVYAADYANLMVGKLATGIKRWRPPRFMPRDYARTVLRIKAERTEMLHAITAEEALREGIAPCPDPVAAFMDLWKAIHGDTRNRLVWRIEFKWEDTYGTASRSS
jgi:hypothetical protein